MRTSLPFLIQPALMTGIAEIHPWFLILHQHSRLIAGVRLVAGQAVHLSGSRILGIDRPRDWMEFHGVPRVVLQRQDRHVILLRQLHFSVENCNQMLTFQPLRHGVRPMAFQASALTSFTRNRCSLSFPCASWQVPQPSRNAGRCKIFLVFSISACSVWHVRQISTPFVFGSPGVLLACGEWQSVQSPAAPGCCTFAVAICLACSPWHVTHNDFASACVSTTFP